MEPTDEIDEQITFFLEQQKLNMYSDKVFTGVDEYTPKNKEDVEGKDNKILGGVYGDCKRAL